MYSETWKEQFAWGEDANFDSFPRAHAESLLNGGSLRSAGRSPAVDYWRNRQVKLDGRRNHVVCSIRTDPGNKSSPDGVTTCYVMRSRKVKQAMPCDATIDSGFAETLVALVSSEGKALTDLLCKVGIVVEDGGHRRVDRAMLDHFFHDHAVVITGHLSGRVWPRFKRATSQLTPGRLCTCYSFIMHADCEHVIFVKALQGDRGVNLAAVPTERPRGRKRKFEE